MKVLILGIDGYIGWPLAHYLLSRDHEVYGVDNLSRRKRVAEIGSNSLTPIQTIGQREMSIRKYKNFKDTISTANIQDPYIASRIIEEYEPDCIVHLAEQPSAPYSMISPRTCIDTQVDNLKSTLSILWALKRRSPNTHLLKLGTMGEYGTPNCDIPEGLIPSKPCAWTADMAGSSLTKSCPMKGLMFPRSPNSFYHLSKVHDTHNIKFACDTWGLRSTDIMQGVVFGVRIASEGMLKLTRFDYDQYFGTVINRFCTQALAGIPLTIYGTGEQIRGYLPLKDSIQCLTIALENPPAIGEYRTLNQFENIYTIKHLAAEVLEAANFLGIDSKTQHLDNPRTEANTHYYNPDHHKLFDLGYVPTTDIQAEIIKLINDLTPFKDRIIKDHIMPTTTWR